jgi:hypothetical protein
VILSISTVVDSNKVPILSDFNFNLDPVLLAGNFRRFESMALAYGLSILDSPPRQGITDNSSSVLDRCLIKNVSRVNSSLPDSSVADHELVVLNQIHSR